MQFTYAELLAIAPDNAQDRARITSVSIPRGVTSIPDGAFYNLSSITEIIVPESVKTCGKSAFQGCYSATNISIPDNAVIYNHNVQNYHGGNPFEGCMSIVERSSTLRMTAKEYCRASNIALCAQTKYQSLHANGSIPDERYKNYVNLQEVTLNGCTQIGRMAFEGAIHLHTVNINNNNNSPILFGREAFKGAINLYPRRLDCR